LISTGIVPAHQATSGIQALKHNIEDGVWRTAKSCPELFSSGYQAVSKMNKNGTRMVAACEWNQLIGVLFEGSSSSQKLYTVFARA
jgi:hypothetical protein